MAGSKKRNEKYKDFYVDTEGKAIYTGESFMISGEEPSKLRAVLATMVVLLAAAVIGSGCIDARSAMGAFYVILPYIGEVSALFALAWHSAKVLSKAEIRSYVLDSARKTIPGASRVLTVFAGFGAIASIVYLARYGAGDEVLKSFAYISLKVAAAIMSEIYGKTFGKIQWDKID